MSRKETQWQWSDAAQIAFQSLKEGVCQSLVLAQPDFQETFYVETDAYGLGIGFVLQQEAKPIAIFSKASTVKHHALSINDKEMLAVKKWHPYLVGRHFIIKIDHQSLKFLSKQKAITPYQ